MNESNDKWINSEEFDLMEFVSMADAKVKPRDGKHTPGPWIFEKQRGQVFTAIGGPIAIVGGEHTMEKYEYTVGVSSDFGPHGPEQTEANARLIAAAPELLKACKMALDEMTECINANESPESPPSQKVMEKIRAIVNKATGESY